MEALDGGRRSLQLSQGGVTLCCLRPAPLGFFRTHQRALQETSLFLVPANHPNPRVSPAQELVIPNPTMGRGHWSSVTHQMTLRCTSPQLRSAPSLLSSPDFSKSTFMQADPSSTLEILVVFGRWENKLTAVLLIRLVRCRTRMIHLVSRAHEQMVPSCVSM